MTLKDPYRDVPRHPRQQQLQAQRYRELLADYNEFPVDSDQAQTRKLLKRLETTLNEISYTEIEASRLRRLLLTSQEDSAKNHQGRKQAEDKLRIAIAANKLLSQQNNRVR